MPLTGKQNQYLRSLGHHLNALVQIGKHGVTESVTAAVDQALLDHELIKIRIHAEAPGCASASARCIEMNAEKLQRIRTIITRAKRLDLFFTLIGMLSLMVGVLTFTVLFVDMAIQGVPRLDLDFFTSFPSRRAANAGILSAWVGTILVMVLTALAAVPLGVAAGVYLEEYAPKNWITDIIEINISNLAGIPSIVYGLLSNSCTINIVRYANLVGRSGDFDLRHYLNGWVDRYFYKFRSLECRRARPFSRFKRRV